MRPEPLEAEEEFNDVHGEIFLCFSLFSFGRCILYLRKS